MDTESEGVTESARVSHHTACQLCPRLAVHFYSAVVIIVIIYHYSGRERKIVSTDDMGAVRRACCNSWDGETLACKMWV